MGGEPGTYLVRWAKHQELPEGYEVVWVDGLYWWQNDEGDCGGECWNRWVVRRWAIEHWRQRQNETS